MKILLRIKEKVINFQNNFKIKNFERKLESILFYLGIILFFTAIYELGFLSEGHSHRFIHTFYYISLLFYFVSLSFRIPLAILSGSKKYLKIIKIIVFIFLLFYFVNIEFLYDQYRYEYLIVRAFGNIYFVYLFISLIFFIEVSKNTLRIFKFNINPEILFVSSFFILIMLGAGFLMIPNSTTGKISFVDALFTATSATCVTGLAINDTAVSFTFLGKSIILVLIQIGGLGVMTFTSFIVYFFRDTSSFRNSIMLKDMVNSEKLGDVFKTILKIAFYTFFIEAIGFLFIYFSVRSSDIFNSEIDTINFSIFHSISAFCNAGFSTVTNGMASNFFRYNYSFQLIVSFLVIFGGIGFPILLNMHRYIKIHIVNFFGLFVQNKQYIHYPRLISVNTKLAVIVTFWLLVIGTAGFMWLEYNNTLQEHPLFIQKLIVSFYNSSMPRTAGFNNLEIQNFLVPTLLFIIFLMWVGASPASTGGGIKTTTFGVAIIDIISLLQGKDRLEVFKRKIANSTVRSAFAVIMISFIIVGCGIFLMSIFESPEKISILAIVFECFSAFGTVGLSVGITPILTDGSKMVLVVLMFLGRVGTLTLAATLFTKVKSLNYMYPKEKIYIG